MKAEFIKYAKSFIVVIAVALLPQAALAFGPTQDQITSPGYNPEGRIYCSDINQKNIVLYSAIALRSAYYKFEKDHQGSWFCDFYPGEPACCCREDGTDRSCIKTFAKQCSRADFAESFDVSIVYNPETYPVKSSPDQPDPSCSTYENNKYCCCRPTLDPATGKTKKECIQTFYSQACNAASFGAEADNKTVVPNHELTGTASENATKVQSGYDKPVIISQTQDCSVLADKANTTNAEASKTSLGEALSTLQTQSTSLNKLHYTGIPQLIGQIINSFLGVMGAISFVLYIYAGVLWMTSAGNSEQTQSAKNIFLWTTLGLLAIFGSYIVVSQVFKFIRVGGTI